MTPTDKAIDKIIEIMKQRSIDPDDNYIQLSINDMKLLLQKHLKGDDEK